MSKKNTGHQDPIRIGLIDMPETHPARLFNDYWEKAKGHKVLPLRRELLPHEIPALLPHIILLEVKIHNNRQDYFDRLEGESVIEICGGADSGKFISETLPADKFDQRHNEFVAMGATKTPIFETGFISYLDKDYIKVVRGAFPFSKEGDTADYFVLVLAKSDLQILGY